MSKILFLILTFFAIQVLTDDTDCPCDLLFCCFTWEPPQAKEKNCAEQLREYRECMSENYGEESFKSDVLLPEKDQFQTKITRCFEESDCDTTVVPEVFGQFVTLPNEDIRFEADGQIHEVRFGDFKSAAKECGQKITTEKLLPALKTCTENDGGEEMAGFVFGDIFYDRVIPDPKLAQDPFQTTKDHFDMLIDLARKLQVKSGNESICPKGNDVANCIDNHVTKAEEDYLEIHTLGKHRDQKRSFCKSEDQCKEKIKNTCQETRKNLPTTACSCLQSTIQSSFSSLLSEYFGCISGKLGTDLKFSSMVREAKIGNELKIEIEHKISSQYCPAIQELSGKSRNICEKSPMSRDLPEQHWNSLEIILDDGRTGYIVFPRDTEQDQIEENIVDFPLLRKKRQIQISRSKLCRSYGNFCGKDCGKSKSRRNGRSVSDQEMRLLFTAAFGGLPGALSLAENDPMIETLKEGLLNPIRAVLASSQTFEHLTTWGEK